MQYILLIYGQENLEMSKEEAAAQMEGYNAFTKEVRDRGLMVAGEAMLDTELTAVAHHRLVAKRGAEGVQCAGWDAGGALGMAAKVGDGDNGRARVALAAETLRQMGVLRDEDVTRLAEIETLTVRTMTGAEVGRVRPAFSLQRG